MLCLLGGCSPAPSPSPNDRTTETRTAGPQTAASTPAAISLVISHTAGGQRPPASYAHVLLDNPHGFSVHADRAVARQPIWETEQSGSETTHTFQAPGSVTMRLRVTEGPVEEGQDKPSASAAFEVRSGPTEWTLRAIVPPGPLTEHMEPVPDVTGDGIPEILRIESRVPCDGGDWAQVVSVLPELRVLASLHSDGKGCEH